MNILVILLDSLDAKKYNKKLFGPCILFLFEDSCIMSIHKIFLQIKNFRQEYDKGKWNNSDY